MTVRAAAARGEAVSSREGVERFRTPKRRSTLSSSRHPAGNGRALSVAVLGGGVAGLAAAYRLAHPGETSPPFDVTVFEGSHRFGGKVETVRRDGFVLESGPDSFVARKPAALELARELGLEGRLLGTRDAHRRVLLRTAGDAHDRGDRLTALPDGLAMVAPTRLLPFLASPLVSWRGKARAALDLVLPRRGSGDAGTDDDESVGAFLRRRLGTEMLEAIGGPLLAGIHGTDPDELSLHSTFPGFAELERRHGSLIRGLRAARRSRRPSATSTRLTFRDGLAELVDALVGRLEGFGVRLRVSSPVRSLHPLPGGGFELRGEGFEPCRSDAVVLALPPHAAAALVETFDRRLAWELRQARAASTATVSLAYRRDEVTHPLDAYGFIAGKADRPRAVAACTFTSTKFAHRAPAGTVLLRAFVGEASGLTGADDGTLIRHTDGELRGLLGITGEPLLTQVRRFPDGSPQYRVGHGERMAALDRRLHPFGDRLAVAGCGFHGVGLPDCIESGHGAADRVSSGLAAAHGLRVAATRRAGGL